MKGTVDFSYDFDHDLVIARPRWTLNATADVMRWYQLHANYFGARFRAPKDLITVNDAFDVLPKVATVWGAYRAKLHDAFVRHSVRVNNNARVRLSTNTSGVRYSISTLESPSVEEAIAAILAVRATGPTERSGTRDVSSPSVRELTAVADPKAGK
jgi:hypothetical protein